MKPGIKVPVCDLTAQQGGRVEFPLVLETDIRSLTGGDLLSAFCVLIESVV